MQAFFSDTRERFLPDGHRFPVEKYALLKELVETELPDLRLRRAELVTEGELALVHSPAYVQAFIEGSLAPALMREIGFPWSPAVVERARRSCGATVAACQVALNEGIAANLAGGTHHAMADRGGGFCVFNDVAVAARAMQMVWARHRRPPLNVAVIDLDVHQGNGTAAIFRGDESVFTLSMHGEKNFPFRKVPSDLDVDLPDGCDDGGYLVALEDALAELGRRFQPRLIIYIAGADPLAGDRLGRLGLTLDGLEQRDRFVLDWAWRRRIPLAMTMGGGYGHDIAHTVRAQGNSFHLAWKAWQRWQNLPA